MGNKAPVARDDTRTQLPPSLSYLRMTCETARKKAAHDLPSGLYAAPILLDSERSQARGTRVDEAQEERRVECDMEGEGKGTVIRSSQRGGSMRGQLPRNAPSICGVADERRAR